MHNAYQGLSDSSNNKPVYDVGADAGNDDIPTNCRKSHEREGPKGKEEKHRVGVALIASLQAKPLPNINFQCARADGHDGHDDVRDGDDFAADLCF